MVTIAGSKITFSRGDSVRIPLTLSGYDIATGDKVMMAVRSNSSGLISDYDLVTEDGLVFIIPTAQSTLMMSGSYSYEIRLIRANGERTLVLKEGSIEIEGVIK